MARIKSFPIYSLRVITPRLTLRVARLEELDQLATSSKDNVLIEETKHFFDVDWTSLDSPEYEQNFFCHNLYNLSQWKKDDWTLNLTIFYKHIPIGSISIKGDDFSNRKELATGSWILKNYRGRGLGSEARAGALAFGFNKLEAETFVSDAHKDNIKSERVSSSLGYKQNGLRTAHEPLDLKRYLLIKEDWVDDTLVEVKGFKHCKDLF